MLLSAGVKLPDSIVAHGWWTSNGEKMSKSRNNVINPEDEIKKHCIDSFDILNERVQFRELMEITQLRL